MYHPTYIDVPDSDASMCDIWKFSMTFNAYERAETRDRAGVLSLWCQIQWEDHRHLPDDLTVLRTALFMMFRAIRHRGFEFGIKEKEDEYIRALVNRIGELTGGQIYDVDDTTGFID